MALKSKKDEQYYCASRKGQATSPMAMPMPHFPKQLLSMVGRQSTLLTKDIGLWGVTKSWSAPPRQFYSSPAAKSPWPPHHQLLKVGDNTQLYTEVLGIIHGHEWFLYWSGARRFRHVHHPCKKFMGFSHVVLFAGGVTPSQYYLYSSPRKDLWILPKWDTNIPFKYAALSSTPQTDPNRIMLVLTGTHHPAFVYYRLAFNFCRYKWCKQVCKLADPYSSNKRQLMHFTNAVGSQGKFYALSLQGSLAVIEYVDSELRITGLGPRRAVPCGPSIMHFKEHLVESEWEILLVFLISRKSTNVVDSVEVHGLDLARLSWVKMERLGDRTLFLGTNCCMSVSASKVGCRRNCVYFTRYCQAIDDWWVYDMEKDGISPGCWNNTDSATISLGRDGLISEQ